MEQITVAVLFSIIITALYAVMKYAERYYGDNPEQWNQTKFLQLVVVAFVLVVVGYLGQGVVAMPDTSLIEQAMTLLGAAVFALTGVKLTKNAVVSLTASSATATADTPDDSIEFFGFTVLPAFIEGKSPYIAVAKVICSQTVAAMTVDWQDGTPVQSFGFMAEGEYYVQNIAHQYTFLPDMKYTGHTFYPEITIVGKNGKKNVFNTAETGRCLSIYVQG